MTDYVEQLRKAVDALVIHSTRAFSWFGRMTEVAPRSRRGVTAAELCWRLQWHLYWNFYCRGRADPVADAAAGDDTLKSRRVRALSRANRGHGCIDSGWSLMELGSFGATVTKAGLTLQVRLDDVIPGSRGVSVRLPKELLGFSPGFYIALADRPLPPGDASFRIYWNLRSTGAVPFVRHATAQLNRLGLPFHLKIVSDPAGFTRCDAAVLYVRTRDLSKAMPAMETIYQATARHLKPLTPAFTKPIAPGVAIAEQPQNHESFGQSRTSVIAESLVQSFRARERCEEARLDHIREMFRRNGIDPAKPYLNPHSRDVYPCLL